jgi:hypothetical protein
MSAPYLLDVPVASQTRVYAKNFVWYAKHGLLNAAELFLQRINEVLDGHDFYVIQEEQPEEPVSESGYTTVTVIVAGALDEVDHFNDNEQEDMEAYLALLETEDFGNEKAEVYLLRHDHPLDDGDCECIQFITDHLPYWTNRDVDGDE